MKLTTYDGLTKSTQEIELIGDENEKLQKEVAQLAHERIARQELRSDQIKAKIALFERLGITADEATLLLS